MRTLSLCRAGAAVCAFALVLLLSGCWSRHELNELAIVVGLGIDKTDEGYKVTAQIVNPSQVSTRNGINATLAPVVTFTEDGRTVPEALRRMTNQSSKRLYFAHLRIVVFGERLARDGIAKPLDYLSRDAEMRNDFYLVVARESTPAEVLGIYSAMDPIPANNLYTKLYNSDTLWAATGQITLDRLTIDLSASGKSPALTGIEIAGNKVRGRTRFNNQGIAPSAVMEYRGMAVFVGDKMVGWLDADGTKALNYLQNSIHQTLGVQKCGENGKLSLAVMHSETRVRVARAGDMPVIHVHVRVESDLSDLECGMDFGKAEALESLRKEARKTLTQLFEHGIEEAQGMGADIFGFGLEVHRQQPALWHRIRDWNEVFRHVRVQVYPDLYVRKIGTIDKSVERMVKE
ncbi:Ger(x)C family spore germination protein [Cohnella nanjingensis]|uniref:Ger(X)C family spore germination protein n=1 Tax=Cohnella nanjingensis TaxID=1387779 RepID=A0A7X0RVY0_9BACL|nr:Ger(x)C family spore germination protein [Cohnella nanjingensis]MBB6674667.1 Ger(x)C family spore germination protein [Cohnella nanjingensis]